MQFVVPGIIAIIMMIVGTVLTAVTIVKEKEQGTIEQIVSSPIGRYELMIGKVMPYAVLAYVDFLLIVVASYFLFGVTIKGSLVLLLVTAFFYLIGVLDSGSSFRHHRNADVGNADRDPGFDVALDFAFRIHLSDPSDAARSADPDDGRSGSLLHRNTARHLFEGPRTGIFLEGNAVHPDLWFCHPGSGRMALSKEAGMKRIRKIVRKEFIQIRRDKGMMRMLVLGPLLQLLIYGYVVATEIRALPMAVLDQSGSAESRRLVDRFTSSGYFTLENVCEFAERGGTPAELRAFPDRARDPRRLRPEYSPWSPGKAAVARGRHEFEYRDDCVAYAGGIIAVASQQETEDEFVVKVADFEAGIREEPRVWFNPSLRAINYMVPGIVCVLLMEMMVPLTAFSLVRERERGTIEQLMVTPVRAGEVLIGKTIPYIVIGLVDAAVILTVGTLWFRVCLSPASLGALLLRTLIFIVVALSGRYPHCHDGQYSATGGAELTVRPRSQPFAFGLHVSDWSMPAAMQYVHRDSPDALFPGDRPGNHDEGPRVLRLWDQVLPLADLGAMIFSISWLRFRRVFG